MSRDEVYHPKTLLEQSSEVVLLPCVEARSWISSLRHGVKVEVSGAEKNSSAAFTLQLHVLMQPSLLSRMTLQIHRYSKRVRLSSMAIGRSLHFSISKAISWWL